MEQIIVLKYYNPLLNVALVSWREVYVLEKVPIRLIPEVSKGNLVYRRRGSAKRISYRQIKKGLVKQNITIRLPWYF